MVSFRYHLDGDEFSVKVPDLPKTLFEAAAVAVWDRFGEQDLTFDTFIHVVPVDGMEGGRLRVGDVLHWLRTPEGQAFLDGGQDNVRFVLDKASSDLLQNPAQHGGAV